MLAINFSLRLFKRFSKSKKGASAVEFALVAPVFLMSMLSTFEIGWFYYVNATIDRATVSIARKVRTGQIQGSQSFDKTTFMNEEVCPKLVHFGTCTAKVTAEVKIYNTFAELAADTEAMVCSDDDPEEVNNITVDPGTENQIARLRLCVIYKTFNPVIGANLAQNASGERRITSSYIFRNEPYLQNQQTGS